VARPIGIEPDIFSPAAGLVSMGFAVNPRFLQHFAMVADWFWVCSGSGECSTA
jgi:hypothetical protein